ncbi:hypothetical protein LTR64_007716 [Lithohypha guttulata]|uniref:uncharacterized protein n=1 Tax=Lithohypha guttulata TaxID=1690604 RepID=UPI002DDFD46D|nr:hypothetical protein LTR51_007225 [Lithohypha guttulata]
MLQTPLTLNDADRLRNNVQGDILGDGFPKQVELFWFFKIEQAGEFRKKLSQLIPLIASVKNQEEERQRIREAIKANITAGKDATSQDARDKSVPSKLANIAFTFTGLSKMNAAGKGFDLNLSPNVGDGADFFKAGMQNDAVNGLQDPPTGNGSTVPSWDKAFLDRKIDGVFLIAANHKDQADQKLDELRKVLGSSVSKVIDILGSAREGQRRRHEHFGFLDGISEPGIKGFDELKLDANRDDREDVDDKELVPPGIVLCNRDQDPVQNRPAWSTDGSFLVFRWLEQKVPEFNQDLKKFAKQLGMNPDSQTDCEGIAARIIGRWPSGALINKHPNEDPMPLSKQVNMTREEIQKALQVNAHVDFGGLRNTSRCPLGSHIRKMNPRDRDIGHGARIMRRGIQFGPEVDAVKEKTVTDGKGKRGLLFVCYQSSIDKGFHFIQSFWANNSTFPGSGAGIDPMVGQMNETGTYNMLGMNKNDPSKPISIPKVNPYVVPLGGEYFFTPSMSALRDTLADNSATPAPQPTPQPTPQPGPPPNRKPGAPGQTVSIFVESRMTGARPSKNVPVDARDRSFAELFGGNVSVNVVGVNGSAAGNIVIEVSGSGSTFRLDNNGNPRSLGQGGAVDVSQWKIACWVTG